MAGSRQLQLAVGSFAETPIPPDLTLDERFALFDEANPWVADALVELADDLVAHGARRIGVKHLFEVLRWHHTRSTVGEVFKLNNNFTSRYARMLQERRPDLAGMIETRTLADGR